MNSPAKLLNLDNPVFCGYLAYGCVLVLKMMLMPILTSVQRNKHGVPASPEDARLYKVKPWKKTHEDVERVRRAHLNDIENILMYFLASFAYLLTDPDPQIALNLFRMYTTARCVHTFVYAMVVVPQPTRKLAWAIAYFITGYMAVKAIFHFKTF